MSKTKKKGNQKKRKQPVKSTKKLQTPARVSFLSYLGDVQGCGTIRVIYPYLLLNHYKQKGIQVHSSYLSQYIRDKEFYKGHTFVQFQRSATEHHLNIYKHFKSVVQKDVKVPLIYEIDDVLFGIPEWNFAHKYYNENLDMVKTMLQIADAVVVSTPYLKKVYSEFNKNISIVPNHLPKFVWGEIYPAHEYKDENRKVKILWAGSQNHFAIPQVTTAKSGGDFGKELIRFVRKTVDKYDWHFKGAWPGELNDLRNSGKITFHNWTPIFEYPASVKAIEPDICLAPLQDIEFNYSKSNIKALEYSALGAPGIYSDVEPYKDCVVKVKTDEEFISEIEKMADDIDYRAKIFDKSLQKVQGQLWWEEDGNLKKYINTYLNMFGHKLP